MRLILLREKWEHCGAETAYLSRFCPHSKFGLVSMNTCGSVVVREDVCLVTAEKNNLEQRYAVKICVELGGALPICNEKIQKVFGNDYHVP
jgi:hypothetical protein